MLDQAQQFDQALRHYWHPVAVSEEVTAEPMQVRLLGETIVLYRDDEGLVALRDKCVHRGVALSGGCIRDGRLMCPYHGWQYDRTGKVAFIPALGAGGAIPSQARVHRYHVREDHGAVWIAPDEPVADLPPWPDDDWNSDDWHVFLVGTWRWQSSAGRMLENAIDFAHFNFVHEGFTELADGAFIKPFEVEVTGDGMRYAYDDSVLLRDYTLHLPFTLHDRKSVMAVSGGVTWSEQGESKAGDITTITFIASPTDRAETLIFSWLSRNHSFDTPDSDFGAGFHEVMEQDRIVVEAQDPAELPLDPREELHLKLADSGSIAYRKLLRDLADRAAVSV
ncbi:MAG: aromatic ring-hydroxylating dioxygenase subunit alpha [Acidimicrobiaceae bacterium]|nr:aromatic ring-hydroxylating dioxygenase subunit alpha [Acidimicrobiaceae bacterium]